MKRTQGSPVSGFTMIEVLVVIIILAILSSLAIPGFSSWLPNYRLKGAVRDLYSNLQLAKSGAIKERGEWAIVFDAGTNSYQIVSGGADRVYSNGGDDVEYKTVTLPDYGSEVSFGAGSATAPVGEGSITPIPSKPIIFNSRGITTDEEQIFAYITNSRNTSYAVGAWASGSVILRKWNGSDWQ
ncbi:MAG: GspH/FimT family pseudopilin [Deltaproteobacteria bacterium]|nr:GspH/FimT family pseudopilin [Deltaproteobacteria bacterium]